MPGATIFRLFGRAGHGTLARGRKGVAVKSSVELFTGCGGLALGLSRAGFLASRMVEWDRHSVENVCHNRGRGLDHIRDWPIQRSDVREIDWAPHAGLDLVAGGPPCQPFSIGGKHRGQDDRRDMWPEAVRAVREAAPRAFLFENVRGLTRPAFAEYLDWILKALSRPSVPLRDGESRLSHRARLRGRPEYIVRYQSVNAADYGAAQKRHRVIILGLRADLGREPPELRPTHSRARLIWDQWVSGDYWTRHGIAAPAGPAPADAALARRLAASGERPGELPWRTVRDAIAGLGAPGAGDLANHVAQPGARAYPGHTGSPLDQPAKALKAGVHGVPGGENMLALADGSVRYLTVREAARLQGLPDDYEFIGSWSENMRQLGNAVPTELAEAAARVLAATLDREAPKAGRRRAA
ncbi:MAG: DNA (cytosine-5-)-methyltransferase [Rhodovulum sulfidophilum]|uniref:DNA (cytosine-5-)-methyltransferase n=1 Tax=Rhodovulum sulfidophilum TaxID=35806 RepID=A0A2W5QBK6_RHOSU|nr:MAG: DNA (cytosine-5-)-methyltransferase [Rhodovulum sulfidophilum]